MPTKWALYLSFLAVPAIASQYTWWVDSSCDGKFADFDGMMKETFETAQIAYDRMSRTKDEEPQAYKIFEALFKFTPGSTDMTDSFYFDEFKRIVGPTEGLQKFTKEPLTGDAGRKASEIRIYCDDDDRMKLVYDNDVSKTPKFDKPNSQRDLKDQEWEDSINKIRSLSHPSCKYNKIRKDGFITHMATYGMKGALTGYDDFENNPGRVSISICPEWLDIANRKDSIAGIPKGKGFPTYGTVEPVSEVKNVGSMVMYHEVHHHQRYYREDKAYQWDKCYALNKDDAHMNADTGALFGVMMRAMERKYGLNDVLKGSWKKDSKIPDWKKPAKRNEVLRSNVVACSDESGIDTDEGLVCKEFSG